MHSAHRVRRWALAVLHPSHLVPSLLPSHSPLRLASSRPRDVRELPPAPAVSTYNNKCVPEFLAPFVLFLTKGNYSCPIYPNGSLCSRPMSSRIFQHNEYVLHLNFLKGCVLSSYVLTVGAKLSFPGSSTPITLLPGVYETTTNPQLLHDALTSSSTSLISSPGFTNSTSISLPLNLALQAGASIYSGSLYSGQAAFSSLPTTPLINSSTPIPAKALVLSSSVWIALKTGSTDRVIVWDAIPDVGQLPQSDQGPLSLLDIQSSSCTPGCSASGVCTSSGTCQCSAGFTGVSCESCSSGFFGPKCQACPANCKTCDDGVNGSGRCLKPAVANDPTSCNCTNGVCGSNGQCTCSVGFTTGDNGTLCSKCSPGFFLTSSGDCQSMSPSSFRLFIPFLIDIISVCNSGCAQCQDGAGSCSTCKSGFSTDANDKTRCNPAPQTASGGTVCPDGSFGAGASCSPCASQCKTCTGASANQCTTCADGLVFLNDSCVSPDSNGICPGTNLIADNNKRECDSKFLRCIRYVFFSNKSAF